MQPAKTLTRSTINSPAGVPAASTRDAERPASPLAGLRSGAARTAEDRPSPGSEAFVSRRSARPGALGTDHCAVLEPVASGPSTLAAVEGCLRPPRVAAPRKLPDDTRFCIIGAGPAGLTAAETLRNKGYRNIVVLEKEDRVGGKCHSVEIGGRVYELGAVLGTPDYRTTRALMEEVGTRTDQGERGNYYDLKKGRYELLGKREKLRLFWEYFVKYGLLSLRNRRVNRPGLDHVSPDLRTSYQSFVDRHHLATLEKSLAAPLTGFGYGYADEIPAVYAMKYMDFKTIGRFSRSDLFTFKDGVQQLWERVAERHDVERDSQVTGIRRGDEVEVEVNGEKRHFDQLILACPLDDALRFIDASEDEKALFSKIENYDYRVFACSIDGLPRDTGYIQENLSKEKIGHPMIWYNRHPDADVYTLYVLGDGKMTNDHVLENIKQDLGQLGGNVTKVHQVANWKYFPHVSPAEMRDGYYERLEGLQGQKNTHYVGELLNFSTVERSASYAKDLVERSF